MVVEKPIAESTGLKSSMPVQVMLAFPVGPATCLAYSTEPMSWVAVAWRVKEKFIIIAKAKRSVKACLQLWRDARSPLSKQVVGKASCPWRFGSFGASPCCQPHAPFSFIDTRDIVDKL